MIRFRMLFLCVLFHVTIITNGYLMEDLSFDTSDLIVEYKQHGIVSLMDAFASNKNAGVEKTTNNHYNNYNNNGRLEWYSVGHPILITQNRSTTLFNWTPKGFYILVDMLNDNQKELFINKIRSKYGVTVEKSQIIKIRLDKLECSLEFSCEGATIRIDGSANEFNEYPFRVEFTAAYQSKERICLESHLIENNEVDFKCEMKKHSKWNKAREVTFSLSSDFLNSHELTDRLFGESDWVYITRKQMNSLAEEIYRLAHIKSEYRLTEEDFSQKFIDGLINQYSEEKAFNNVAFDEGSINLTSYGVEDLDVDQTKVELSNILEYSINEENTQYTVYLKKSETDFSVDTANSGFKLLGGVETLDFFNSLPEKSVSGAATLNIENIIEWEIDFDNKNVVPKSLNLIKLTRKSFEKELQFKKIKVKTFSKDLIYSKQFTLRSRGIHCL